MLLAASSCPRGRKSHGHLPPVRPDPKNARTPRSVEVKERGALLPGVAVPPEDIAASQQLPGTGGLTSWTSCLPVTQGFYELWDPHLGVHMLVYTFYSRGGCLAVRNPCGCVAAFRVEMWTTPHFHAAHWRGPIKVPAMLPEDGHVGCRLRAPTRPFRRSLRHGRLPCLLGTLCQ